MTRSTAFAANKSKQYGRLQLGERCAENECSASFHSFSCSFCDCKQTFILEDLFVHLFKPQTCVLLLILFFANSITRAQQSGPPLLAYNDLLALYENDVPPAELATRLDQILTTPFVNNSIGVRGPKAGARKDFGKRFIRVATWNIA